MLATSNFPTNNNQKLSKNKMKFVQPFGQKTVEINEVIIQIWMSLKV